MRLRKVKVDCVSCKHGELEATETKDGYVLSYCCKSCGAIYDATTLPFCHNGKWVEHWWIGKMRNPAYWKLDDIKFEKGVDILRKRQISGVKEHLGAYLIERIKI